MSTKDFLMKILPTGKLPPELLEKLLKKIPVLDKNVIIGPGTGLDCSVIDYGDQYLVFKSDPISLTSENIGWYAVQINVNDIVTTGADPKWMLITLLLPEKNTTVQVIENITDQLIMATKEYVITIIGGHTEVTNGIDRPILSVTLIGTVDKDKLITPLGAENGDKVFLTKEIAIETVSIISNDFPNKLSPHLTGQELKKAQSYLYDPGISIYKEANLLRDGFGVTAMHDPTEGGLAAALWELSIASNKTLKVNLNKIPISELTKRICALFSINPLNSISSGALLFTANKKNSDAIMNILEKNQIPVSEIGYVSGDGIGVINVDQSPPISLPRPERDEIAKIF
ncbi:MAG: AIR synthase family protein [Anaerolineaceae bacterium]|nr:AIR synthase family protein [Anaerolineaceae bacterium]